MNLFQARFLQSKYLLLFFLILLFALPIFLFGDPGFYADDYNMLRGLEKFGGVWGNYQIWSEEYGILYRPLGILILGFAYSLLGSESLYMYILSFVLYSFWILFLYKIILENTKNRNLAFFAAAFFASFPFCATAFLQLSSIYGMLAGFIALSLIGYVARKGTSDSITTYITICLIWLCLLVTYEQITGLISIIILIVLLRNLATRDRWFSKTIKDISGISLITLTFIGLFFISDTNPKVNVLKDSNNDSARIQAIEIQDKRAQEKNKIDLIEELEINPSNTYSANRIEAVASKVYRTSNFLIQNFSYSINKTIASWKGYILIFFMGIFSVLIISQKIIPPNRNHSLLYFFFGLVWFSSTLAPFFLYTSVHIPPYALLIPSAGLGPMVYGGYWLVAPRRFIKISKVLFKVFSLMLIISMQLQQYGLYFGLKEELSFWAQVSNAYLENEEKLFKGEIIQLEIPKKRNNHIFWYEKFIGHRHFSDIAGISYNKISLDYDIKDKVYVLKLKSQNQ